MEKSSDTFIKILLALAGAYAGYWYCGKVKNQHVVKEIPVTSFGVRG